MKANLNRTITLPFLAMDNHFKAFKTEDGEYFFYLTIKNKLFDKISTSK